MKRLLVIFFVFVYIQLNSQDSILKILHFGVIPVQLIKEYPGVYIGIQKHKWGFEYRYTYKLPSNRVPNTPIHDRIWNYYAGDNHFGIVHFHATSRSSFGLIFCYRAFRFSNQFIPLEHGPYFDQQLKDLVSSAKTSANIKGSGLGLEYGYMITGKPINFELFFNFTTTYFKGNRDEFAYGVNNHTDIKVLETQFSLGTKLGLRRAVSKKSTLSK